MVKGSFLGTTSNNNSCWLQLTFILTVIPFCRATDLAKVSLGKFPHY